MPRLFSKLTFLLLIKCSMVCTAQSTTVFEKCITMNQFEDRYASYSPDGQHIVFESNREGNWCIYLMDEKGKKIRKLTPSQYSSRRPSWHPNGRKILFESDKAGIFELYIVKIKNQKIKKLGHNRSGSSYMFAHFSPDGRFIAVTERYDQNNGNIILLNKKGKPKKVITKNRYRNAFPRWSPNGEELLFFSRKDTQNKDDEIYRIHIETLEEERLTMWPKHNFCPAWSPKDQRIAYATSMEGSRPEIYLMDVNGENKSRITFNENGDTLPSWHPTENRLLITAFRNGNYQICELTLEPMPGNH